jgi:hypothetical protein
MKSEPIRPNLASSSRYQTVPCTRRKLTPNNKIVAVVIPKRAWEEPED